MKKYMMLLVGCIVTGTVLLLSACPGGGNTLIMGTNATFPPFEFIGGENGDEVVGFDVEIAKEIAKKAGKRLRIEDTEFDSLLPALEADKVDFVIAGMTITPERAQSVDFSEPYYSATQVVIVRTGDNRFRSPSDLQDATIAVQLGTTGESLATDITGGNNIVAFNSGFETVLELSSNRVDAVIIDEQPAMNYIANTTDLQIISMDFDSEFYGIAVKKGNTELLAIINATIREMRRNGRYDELIGEFIAR